MKIRSTKFPGLFIVDLDTFEDDRGFFREVFRSDLKDIPDRYAQDNESFSKKGVLRGLHFQREPYAQGKLVRVISGEVQDVVIDLRINSPTWKEHLSIILDESNMMYVPPGFAHGFFAIKDTYFNYKCTTAYEKSAEAGVIWNDKDLNISWLYSWADPDMEEKDAIISAKDRLLPTFQAFNYAFR